MGQYNGMDRRRRNQTNSTTWGNYNNRTFSLTSETRILQWFMEYEAVRRYIEKTNQK